MGRCRTVHDIVGQHGVCRLSTALASTSDGGCSQALEKSYYDREDRGLVDVDLVCVVTLESVCPA